jgi:biotin carboxylase
VIAVDKRDDASGFTDTAQTAVVDDLIAYDECLEIATEAQVDGVVTDECDFSLLTATYVAERLELPGVGIDTALRTTNKARIRRRVGTVVTQPSYAECDTLTAVRETLDWIGYPGIIKPVDSRGAFGVSLVKSSNEVRDAYLDAIANSRAGSVIVEDFVAGTPLTVEGYHYQGTHRTLAIGSKTAELGNLSPDREIVYPARITDEAANRVEELNDEVADVLGVDYGATHAEYILTDDGEPVLVEFHNRGGGIHISAKVVPSCTGFDISRQLVYDALGESCVQDWGTAPAETVFISQLRFDPGTVLELRNLRQARGRDDVLTVQPYFQPGDRLEEFDRPTESHGLVITTGEDTAAARQAAAAVAEQLEAVYQ